MKRKFLSLGSNPPRSKLQFWFIKPFSTALPILSIKLLPSPSRPQISELANESGPHAAALVVVAAGCAVQVGTLETWRWAATGFLFVCPFKGRTLKITGHILHFLHLLPYGILTFFFFFYSLLLFFLARPNLAQPLLPNLSGANQAPQLTLVLRHRFAKPLFRFKSGAKPYLPGVTVRNWL